MRCLRDLLSFLTVIPTGSHDVDEASRCFPLVPVVGLIVGLISLLPLVFSKSIVSVLTSFITIYALTGLTHLDGFADFVDVIASGKKGEEALRVLKEPWRGSFSQASLTLMLIAVFVSMYDLRSLPTSLLMVNVASYSSMFLVSTLAEPPPYIGLGYRFIVKSKGARSRLNFLLSLSISLVIVMLISKGLGENPSVILMFTAVSLALMMLTSSISLRKARETLGFANGDVLGFTLELSRSLGMILLALLGELL